jgi:hypothetical protein
MGILLGCCWELDGNVMGVKHQTCGNIVDVVQNLPFSMTNLWHLPEARLEQPGKVGKLEWETQDM